MVYEIELTIDDDMTDKEVLKNFPNVKKIKNTRCNFREVCYDYALKKISKELDEYIEGCFSGFELLKDYFKQIPIEKARKGDIITYHELSDFESNYEKPCGENVEHFAIVHSTNGSLDSTIVHSKWGNTEVYKTNLTDMPDMYGNAIVVWRIRRT